MEKKYTALLDSKLSLEVVHALTEMYYLDPSQSIITTLKVGRLIVSHNMHLMEIRRRTAMFMLFV